MVMVVAMSEEEAVCQGFEHILEDAKEMATNLRWWVLKHERRQKQYYNPCINLPCPTFI
jgi:hypothetical protein